MGSHTGPGPSRRACGGRPTGPTASPSPYMLVSSGEAGSLPQIAPWVSCTGSATGQRTICAPGHTQAKPSQAKPSCVARTRGTPDTRCAPLAANARSGIDGAAISAAAAAAAGSAAAAAEGRPQQLRRHRPRPEEQRQCRRRAEHPGGLEPTTHPPPGPAAASLAVRLRPPPRRSESNMSGGLPSSLWHG